MDDTRNDDLIRRNHELLAAAAKAWSDFMDTALRIDHAIEQERIWRALWYGGQTEPYHRVITYDVTATGPLGFQVSVLGPYLRDARLIGDFGSLQEAEAFADRMREIDAGTSHVSPMPQHREMDDPRSDDLIDHNHVLVAAATKARSDIITTVLKAEQGREQARVTGTVLNLPLAIFHWRME